MLEVALEYTFKALIHELQASNKINVVQTFYVWHYQEARIVPRPTCRVVSLSKVSIETGR